MIRIGYSTVNENASKSASVSDLFSKLPEAITKKAKVQGKVISVLGIDIGKCGEILSNNGWKYDSKHSTKSGESIYSNGIDNIRLTFTENPNETLILLASKVDMTTDKSSILPATIEAKKINDTLFRTSLGIRKLTQMMKDEGWNYSKSGPNHFFKKDGITAVVQSRGKDLIITIN